MGFLIDTDVFVEHARRGRPLREIVTDEPWAISVISVSELLQGVHRSSGPRRVRRAAWVEELIAGVEVISVSLAVARVHAQLWAVLEDEGRVIGQRDLWIGASAVAYGLGVITHNHRDFARVPGLRVVAP